MRNYWTKKRCDSIIEENKDNTAYFDGGMTFWQMHDMLRFRMGFGKAETMVIIASLIKAGAKFS